MTESFDPTVTHLIKCKSEYFEETRKGNKKFEIRKNDRGYKTGDVIVLMEVGETGIYTGRVITARISYIFYGGEYGLDNDYCVFSLEII